jgi:hypothetical protein
MLGSTDLPHSSPAHLETCGIFMICFPKFQHHTTVYFPIIEFYHFCSLHINPLNAELNPICHLLILLGDLTFMDTCIVSIFQYTSNNMQRYTAYLYLETALHVLGGTPTRNM